MLHKEQSNKKRKKNPKIFEEKLLKKKYNY